MDSKGRKEVSKGDEDARHSPMTDAGEDAQLGPGVTIAAGCAWHWEACFSSFDTFFLPKPLTPALQATWCVTVQLQTLNLCQPKVGGS